MKRLLLFLLIASFALGQGQNFGQYITTNAQTGTTYTVANTDFNKVVTFSNAGAVAVTLPQAGTVGLNTGWYVYVENIGVGTVTITPTTSTIDGAATLALTTNQGAMLVSNGTNYATVRGIGGTSGITGTGTQNVLLKWNNAGGTTAGNSSITDDGTVISSAEPIQAGDGAPDSVVGLGFKNSTGSGFSRGPSGQVGVSVGSYLTAVFSAGILQIRGLSAISWASTDSGTNFNLSSDLFLTRSAAATLQLGAADLNGTPVAQALKAQSGITGSNLAGQTFTVFGSLGTGTGGVSTGTPAIVFKGAESDLASGTSSQVGTVRLALNDTRSLTSGAATTVLSIPLATLAMTGGTVDYYMEATDGTNQCTSKGTIAYAAENSAGVFVTNVTAIGNLATACTATKSLTATWALTGANPALLQITPTLTGITATRFTLIYEVHHMGNTQPTL